MKFTSRELRAIAIVIDEMRKLERQVHRLNEIDCNGEMTARQEKRRDRLENRYGELARELGVYPQRQRDPRGTALRVIDDPAKYDTEIGVTL